MVISFNHNEDINCFTPNNKNEIFYLIIYSKPLYETIKVLNNK